MAEHAWTVLCQKTLLDSDSNLLSLVDVFDVLKINPTPEIPDIKVKLEEVRQEGGQGVTIPTRLRIVSQWLRSDRSKPEQSKFRFALVDPDDQRLAEQEISLELVDSTAQRITIRSNLITVTTLGMYWILIEKPPSKGKARRWTEVTRLPLLVEAAT